MHIDFSLQPDLHSLFDLIDLISIKTN